MAFISLSYLMFFVYYECFLLMNGYSISLKAFSASFLTFPDGSVGKKSACNAGDTDVDSVPGWGSTLEEEMAAHSSILA